MPHTFPPLVLAVGTFIATLSLTGVFYFLLMPRLHAMPSKQTKNVRHAFIS